ncbi:XRE family transcriptional regulator [Coriobacteriales bacterium OH1046]|nr:XRE family transcriptional regulator [Coriobacteriales bacterium OH1046]
MRLDWEFIEKDVSSALEAIRRAPLDGRAFTEWVHDTLTARGLKRKEAIRASQLNQTFAYQIIMGTRHAARDKLIQLAFGMELGIDDACELLERGGTNALLPICRRDVAIAFALGQGMGVLECDDLLWSIGERTLVSHGAAGKI